MLISVKTEQFRTVIQTFKIKNFLNDQSLVSYFLIIVANFKIHGHDGISALFFSGRPLGSWKEHVYHQTLRLLRQEIFALIGEYYSSMQLNGHENDTRRGCLICDLQCLNTENYLNSRELS